MSEVLKVMNGNLKVGEKLLYNLKVRSHWLTDTIEEQTNKAQVSDRFCGYFCLAFDMITYKSFLIDPQISPKEKVCQKCTLG